jgi:hypothetical protein
MLALASRLASTHRLFKLQPQHNHSIASTFEKPRHNSEGTTISVALSNNISSSANGRAKGSDGGGGDSLVVCSKIPQYQSHVFFCAGCLDSTYLFIYYYFVVNSLFSCLEKEEGKEVTEFRVLSALCWLGGGFSLLGFFFFF